MISVLAPLVILEQNLLERTKLFVLDVKAGMNEEDELIVIDNGSTLGQEYMIDTSDIYVHTHSPIGYGPALNLGMKIANNDYFLISNNDMRVDTNWRNKMLEKFVDKVGIVSCHGQHMFPSTGTAFNGIFWMVKKEVTEDIGLFDFFKPREGDDSDFCLRAVKAGWDIDTADFFYDHPERKSTHNQKDFNLAIKDSPQWQFGTFQEKWGFGEKEWYRKALEMRNR